MTTPPAIDPSAGVDGALDAVVSGVNDNLGTLAAVGGGMVAIGVVWRLFQKFTGKKA